MNRAAALLRDVGVQIEPEVQKQLGGLFGGFVRAYLPQAWVFETNQGTATLLVDRTGAVSVVEGASEHPDVTLTVPFEPLAHALKTRTKMAPEAVTVTPHTAKGRTAFDYLKSRVGL
jgi:hypothetical protein